MRRTKASTKGLLSLCLILIWSCAACTYVDRISELIPRKLSPRTKTSSPNAQYYKHIVRWQGETLSLVAKWYTGDMENWRALARANPKLDPNHIEIGAKILIPRKLMITRKPMSRGFVAGTVEGRETEARPLAKVKTSPRPIPTRQKPSYHIHRVRWQGETLSLVAKWYTGDMENWRALARANPKLDPNHIEIGAKILIPRKLMITRKNMPRDFATRSASEKKPQPPKASPLPAEKEDLELFGPK